MIVTTRNAGKYRQSSQSVVHTFPFLLGLLYVFDEQINLLVHANIIGSLLYVLATFIFCYRIILSKRAISLKLGALLILITLFSFIAYSSSWGCSVVFKGAFSLLLLWLVVLAMQIVTLAEIVTLKSISNVVLISVLAFVCLDAMGIHLLSSDRNAGSYYEPSHLAMYVIPFIAYRFLKYNRDMLSWMAVAVVMLVAPNSTFLVGLIGIFVLWLIKGRYLSNTAGRIRIALVIAFVTSLLALIDISNIQDRISGVLDGAQGNETSSVSAIVWLNGWSQASEYFAVTRGLGVGFNQMGCEKYENLGQFSSLMFTKLGVVLNSQDGSFLAAKLVSEFGFVGILLVISLMLASVNSIFNINKDCGGGDSSIALARAVGGICLLSLLFVRGAGYFQLPVILAISLLTLKLPKQAPITKNNYG